MKCLLPISYFIVSDKNGTNYHRTAKAPTATLFTSKKEKFSKVIVGFRDCRRVKVGKTNIYPIHYINAFRSGTICTFISKILPENKPQAPGVYATNITIDLLLPRVVPHDRQPISPPCHFSSYSAGNPHNFISCIFWS